MSFLTVFLARLFGVYCLVIAAAMLIRRRETITTINAMIEDPGAIMLAGVVALAVGVATILGHNVWAGGPLTVAVTVVGWAAALKGVWLLATPSAILGKVYAAMNLEQFFTAYMGVTLAVGAVMIWATL